MFGAYRKEETKIIIQYVNLELRVLALNCPQMASIILYRLDKAS